MRITGGTPRIGITDYFATEFLGNARHLTELAEARETRLLAEGFRGVDTEIRTYVLSAIFQSVAYLEAYANGVWGDAAEVTDPANPPNKPPTERIEHRRDTPDEAHYGQRMGLSARLKWSTNFNSR